MKLPMIMVTLAVLLVAGAVITGLMLTGGPEYARLTKLDRKTSEELQTVQTLVTGYYSVNHKLPEQLADVKAKRQFRQWEPEYSPLNDPAYRYAKVNETRFQLCATFKLESPERNQTVSYQPKPSFYNHPAGSHCFFIAQEPPAKKAPSGATPSGRQWVNWTQVNP